jgi:hypothetical protein
MNPESFFIELQRRNVIRVAGLYLVGAWLLTQVASILLPAFDVPSWALRALIVTLAIGFIPAVMGVNDLLTDPLLRTYKDDPRFIAFAQKIGVMPKPGAKP